jgi:NitT/TauT family transport system permease protein
MAFNTDKPIPGGLWSIAVFCMTLAAMAFPVQEAIANEAPIYAWQFFAGAIGLCALIGAALLGVWPGDVRARWRTSVIAVVGWVAALCWLSLPPASGELAGAAGFWLGAMALGCLSILTIIRSAWLDGRWGDAWWAAVLFGVWVVVFWELLALGLGVPRVLLPAPSWIAHSISEHLPTLGQDFVQTVLKSVFVGWVLGCGLGFGVAIAIDRAPFLQRGLLPLASLTSTVPLVGVAPIAVMWFGFDWPSKAAVVVLMTFFPMLVATLAGLQAADRLQRELMHTYAATYRQTLTALRLPSAFPFVASALKVNASLALIGAIVAEFFGSPTAGLGFRISTEAARMNMGLVWGAIAVAAVTGSVAYALLVRVERRWAFWHPSVRTQR